MIWLRAPFSRLSRFSHSSFPQRQLDTHRRPFPRFAFPSHFRADFPGSFADADAAEVAGLAVGLGGGVEALAVVGDADFVTGRCLGGLGIDEESAFA